MISYMRNYNKKQGDNLQSSNGTVGVTYRCKLLRVRFYEIYSKYHFS
jgi:hypothetical protein